MKVLDLFCGAGGAAMGLHQALTEAGIDHEIVGVDIAPQKHYPFRFIEADALTFPLDGADFVHSSPPCQPFTALRSVFDASRYADLIEPVRERLERSGVPYVIENVPGAPIRADAVLCGNSFGLRTYRHRLFECSFPVMSPVHSPHVVKTSGRNSQRQRKAQFLRGGFATVTGNIGSHCGPEAMGIDWMTGRELSQAIPPAYSAYIMRAWLAQQAGSEAAS